MSGSVVTLALGGGEYFFELRPATSVDDAARARPLNRATHFVARERAEAAASG